MLPCATVHKSGSADHASTHVHQNCSRSCLVLLCESSPKDGRQAAAPLPTLNIAQVALGHHSVSHFQRFESARIRTSWQPAIGRNWMPMLLLKELKRLRPNTIHAISLMPDDVHIRIQISVTFLDRVSTLADALGLLRISN